MAEFPRIARERLQALGSASGEHPDADLLTAFAERTLAEGERGRVMEHLARCADCREVVSLALPEVEAAPEEAPSRHWLSSPALHWGVVFASVVVVGAALLQVQRPPTPTELELARSERAGAPVPPAAAGEEAGKEAAVEQAPAAKALIEAEASKDVVADGDSRRAAQKTNLLREKEEIQANRALAEVGGSKPVTPGVGGGIGTGAGAGVGSGVAGGRVGGFSDSSARRDEAAARARRSGDKADAISATEEARAPAAPAAAPTTGKNAVESFALSQREADNKVAASEAAAFERPAELPMKKHPASTAATDSLAVNGALAASESELEKSKTAAARWSVTSEGRVQRSLDGARTWQDVAIAQNVRFRAVAAVGASVWAGGSSGALYHSADGGESWKPQSLAAGKTGLMAYKVDDRAAAAFDIVRIDFRDVKNGTLTTSDEQTWVTSDGGSSWKKP